MPIQRLLAEGNFDPNDIRRMVAAYDAARELLGLKDRSDLVCEVVAAKIIQVYRTGEHDPPHICAQALKELGMPLSYD
jgi:hypothetical protein